MKTLLLRRSRVYVALLSGMVWSSVHEPVTSLRLPAGRDERYRAEVAERRVDYFKKQVEDVRRQGVHDLELTQQSNRYGASVYRSPPLLLQVAPDPI